MKWKGHEVDYIVFSNKRYVLVSGDSVIDEITDVQYFSNPQLRRLPYGKYRRATPHGKYRRATPQVHSRPVRQPGPRYVRAGWTPPGAQSWAWSPWSESEPIQDTGVRAGEIKAYRAWVVNLATDRLHSIINYRYEWEPGGVARGDVRYYGIFTFKSVNLVEQFIEEERDKAFAFGSVWIWGDVIEHEHGYRSSHAKIASIDYVSSFLLPAVIARVRRLYNVPGE